jgi:hypothetical protein
MMCCYSFKKNNVVGLVDMLSLKILEMNNESLVVENFLLESFKN